MSLPLKELISIGAKQLRDAGVADAEIDAKELYCFMQNMDRTSIRSPAKVSQPEPGAPSVRMSPESPITIKL